MQIEIDLDNEAQWRLLFMHYARERAKHLPAKLAMKHAIVRTQFAVLAHEGFVKLEVKKDETARLECIGPELNQHFDRQSANEIRQAIMAEGVYDVIGYYRVACNASERWKEATRLGGYLGKEWAVGENCTVVVMGMTMMEYHKACRTLDTEEEQ